ncbi:MAG TPA: hypothetical protein PLR43_04380, partial [Syntrophales bacterium]|nr:hypothetical protein [Syntrophales bacterium]
SPYIQLARIVQAKTQKNMNFAAILKNCQDGRQGAGKLRGILNTGGPDNSQPQRILPDGVKKAARCVAPNGGTPRHGHPYQNGQDDSPGPAHVLLFPCWQWSLYLSPPVQSEIDEGLSGARSTQGRLRNPWTEGKKNGRGSI